MENKRILITSGRLWAILTIIRDFKKLGYKIDLADSAKDPIAKYSNAVDRFFLAPKLTYNPKEYLNFILDLAQKNNYAFIVPVHEEVFALATIKNELEKYTKILVNDFETYMNLHDKARLYDFCMAHGLYAPKTIRFSKSKDASFYLERFTKFPVFVKFRFSRGSLSLIKTNNREELEKELKDLKERNDEDLENQPIIQEGINGYQIASQAVFRDGELYAIHMYKNVVEFPPGSGVGVVRESAFRNDIKEAMMKIGKIFKYNGLLGIDFLIDPITGKPHIIDANPRVIGGIGNAHHSGVSMADGYARAALGMEPLDSDYMLGIKTRTLLMHVMWLIKSIKMKKESLVSIIKSYFKLRFRVKPEIASLEDLGSTLMFPIFIAKAYIRGGFKIDDKLYDGVFFTAETFKAMGK